MSPEEFVSRLDRLSEKSLNAFLSRLQSVSEQLYEETLILLGTLQTRTGGTIRATADNLAKVEVIGRKLDALLKSSEYAVSVNELVKSFSGISDLVDSYMSTLVSNFSRNQDLYKAVRKANIQTTVDSLLGGGMDFNFINPVKKLLRQNVAGNTDLTSLKKALRAEIVENSRLARYADVVASDAVEQFSRNYIQTVSNDLKLEYFLYAGTVISDSRDFCAQRAGKYYTRTQIESWAELKWQGKNPATNKSTIFIYLGGFKCKHKVIPVSKTVYEANK